MRFKKLVFQLLILHLAMCAIWLKETLAIKEHVWTRSVFLIIRLDLTVCSVLTALLELTAQALGAVRLLFLLEGHAMGLSSSKRMMDVGSMLDALLELASCCSQCLSGTQGWSLMSSRLALRCRLYVSQVMPPTGILLMETSIAFKHQWLILIKLEEEFFLELNAKSLSTMLMGFHMILHFLLDVDTIKTI